MSAIVSNFHFQILQQWSHQPLERILEMAGAGERIIAFALSHFDQLSSWLQSCPDERQRTFVVNIETATQVTVILPCSSPLIKLQAIGKAWLVPQNLLIEHSPAFAMILQGGGKEQEEKQLTLPYDAPLVSVMLSLFQGNQPLISPQQLIPLALLAGQYMLARLEEYCLKCFQMQLTAESCAYFYQLILAIAQATVTARSAF